MRLALGLALWAALVPAAPARGERLVVLAAASLTDAMRALAAAFEEERPGTEIVTGLGSSATLALQVAEGAAGDVLAAADEPTMARLVAGGHVAGAPVVFARTTLVIAVPAGNPSRIAALADLAAPGVTLALCAPSVPCGRYAVTAFARAGLPVPAASQERDVRAVATKIALGEVDAGLVYAPDVRASGGRLAAVALPAETAIEARYPIAVLRAAAAPATARAFVAFVRSPPARAILADLGFTLP